MLAQIEKHLTATDDRYNCFLKNRRVDIVKKEEHAGLCVGSELRSSERIAGRSRVNREIHARSL